MIFQFLLLNGRTQQIDINSKLLQLWLIQKSQPINNVEVQAIYNEFQLRIYEPTPSAFDAIEEDAFQTISYIKDNFYPELNSSASEVEAMPMEAEYPITAPTRLTPSVRSAFSLYTPRTTPNSTISSNSSDDTDTLSRKGSLDDRNGFFNLPTFKKEPTASALPTGSTTYSTRAPSPLNPRSKRRLMDTSNPAVADQAMEGIASSSTTAPNAYNFGLYTPQPEQPEQLEQPDDAATYCTSPL